MKMHEIAENIDQNEASSTLNRLSRVAGSASQIAQIVAGTAGPLMIASSILDVVRAIATTDEEFVDKIKNAKAQAELTKKPVKFTHPANLPGPLKIASQLADFFGGKLEGTFVVTPKGELKYDPTPEEKNLAQRLRTGDEETGAGRFTGTGGLY